MVDFNNRQSFVFVLILNKMCYENGILDKTLLLLLSTRKKACLCQLNTSSTRYQYLVMLVSLH